MAYDIRFDVTQTGTETIDQITSKMVVMKTQITAASAEMKKAAQDVAGAQKEMAAAVASGNTELAAQAGSAVVKAKDALSSLVTNVRQLKTEEEALARAAKKMGDAHEAAVPQVAAASGAIRVLEGTMPIRAVERFAVNILGLGPLLQAAFPLVGLIAFSEMFSSTFEKIDPFVQAEKKLDESTKELDKTFESLGKRLDRLKIREMTDLFGAAAGAKLAATFAGTGVAEKRAAAKSMQPQIDKAQNEADEYTRNAGYAGAVAGEPFKRFAAAKNADVQRMKDQQSALTLEANVDEAEANKDVADALKDQKKTAAQKAKEASEQQYEQAERGNREFEEKRNAIDSFGRKALSPVQQIYARRDEVAQRLGIRGSDRDELDANANAEAGTELTKQGNEQRKYPLSLTGSGIPAEGGKGRIADRTLGPDGENDIKRLGEIILSALKEANSAHNKDVTESGAEAVRANASRGAFADKMTGLNPVLTEAQKIVALNLQDLETARQKYEIEKDTASELATEAEQKDARHKADLDNALELRKVQEENVERIRQLENKNIEEFRGLIGGLFDAATSHSPNAVPNFIKSQVLGIGKTITENAAQKYILPEITKIIPHASGGLGGLLKGTPFEADPMKSAGVTLNSAGVQLIAAARALAMSRSGGGGGAGNGLPGLSGLPSGGGDFSSDPSAGSDIGDGLPMSSASMSPTGSLASSMGPLSASGGSGFGFNGKTLAAGAAAVGAGFMAAKDFSTGGAKSDIAGVGAVLGGAAGIAALIPGGQVVALGLGIAAAATSLISAVMPDPHVVRQNAINQALAQNQYVAPQALNATQDSGGNFADFDVRGNLRTSNFSAIPSVRQGSTWEQTHGLFDGPPTFYNVPGGQTSQYGAVTPPPPVWTINVNAIDTQTGLDFIDKNHLAIGGAAAKSMQNIHGPLTAEVQRAAAG